MHGSLSTEPAIKCKIRCKKLVDAEHELDKCWKNNDGRGAASIARQWPNATKMGALAESPLSCAR